MMNHGSFVLAATWVAAAASIGGRAMAGDWVDISTPVIAKLAAAGRKPAWPGGAAGITADPQTGDVYMVVPGQGLWKSTDRAASFSRIDGGGYTGRCETGAALQVDPDRGGRLASFTLDGRAGMTLDGGKNWTWFKDVGRNWDYGAVDWSADRPLHILAMRHESGGELYLTHDGGDSWKQVAKNPSYGCVGIFDDKTLITCTKDEILRSTDGGAAWTPAGRFAVLSHVVIRYRNTAYLIASQGLIASTDRGATWRPLGRLAVTKDDITFGPAFKDASHFIVWGSRGILRTDDGGDTWTLVAPPPSDYMKWSPQWMNNVAWDVKTDAFYTSHMSLPAYRWQK